MVLLKNIIAVIGVLSILYFIIKLISNIDVVKLFMTTRFVNVPISFYELLFMKMRGVDLGIIVNTFIVLRKAYINVKLKELEVAWLDGINLEKVSGTLMEAKKK
ncbi:flotillin-like FloA family protein [Fulvivirga sediminis]|uniref:Flotillin-like FloA family protein n=1 Tax=Fulvivirga sediminis TaxID=2803949 RepID=A0A937K0Y9_9BACT|nr:flotillin-like FloA family protein [Fulvivirga sediminis]MBL3658823.1 flotillin-like FloA family protein [Fulvivirga sediminis]